MPTAEQAGRLPGARHPNADHAEDTAVQLCPSAQPSQIARSVRIVGDQQRLRRFDLHAVCPRSKLCSALPVQQIREHVQRGRELVVSVSRGKDNLCIGAEGGVVDERPPADDP
jgi:hypothetical protein